MNISDLKYDFSEYLEIEKGSSTNTIRNYDLCIERFIEFAGDIEVEEITPETVNIVYGSIVIIIIPVKN